LLQYQSTPRRVAQCESDLVSTVGFKQCEERVVAPDAVDAQIVAQQALRTETLAKHGYPQIFNTDQGRQFTSAEFTGVLVNNGISISMDGRGAWRDNVFVKRFWQVRGSLSARL
jgi:transposase InsO family protein